MAEDTQQTPQPERRKDAPAPNPAGSDYERGRQIGALELRMTRVEGDLAAIGVKLDGQARDFDLKLDKQTETLTSAIENRFQPLAQYIEHQREVETRKAEEDARKDAAYQQAEAAKKAAAEARDRKVDQLTTIGITILGSLAVTQIPALFTAVAGNLPPEQMALLRGLSLLVIVATILFVVWTRNTKGAQP